MRLKPLAFTLILTAGLCAAGPRLCHAQTTAPTKPPALPDAFSVNGDSLASVRKGLLSYAVAPLSEPKLKLLDGSSRELSLTVPLVVDRSRIAIDAKIDNKKVRLGLDTGGDAGVTLNQPTAAGITLYHPSLVTLLGVQGSEPATEGIAHSMTVGTLTLRAIDTVAIHGTVSDRNANVLGTSIFANYRITLDFDANTLTLSRGGLPMAPAAGEESLSVPFHQSDDGQIYLAVHICGQSTWACLDTGLGLNSVSLTIAKAAATQLPPNESASGSTNAKIGLGNTVKGTKMLAFKRPLPVLLDTNENADFSTTSQFGASFYEDVINSDPTNKFHQGASLGLPFFLQFHRVIIDYPNHKLILQGRKHGDPLFTAKPGVPWPGYLWQRAGDGYIEVPEQPVAVAAPPVSTSTVTVTSTATTSGTTLALPTGTTIIVTGNPSSSTSAQTIIVNGVKYECPAGSMLTVGADGKANITPLATTLGQSPTVPNK